MARCADLETVLKFVAQSVAHLADGIAAEGSGGLAAFFGGIRRKVVERTIAPQQQHLRFAPEQRLTFQQLALDLGGHHKLRRSPGPSRPGSKQQGGHAQREFHRFFHCFRH